MNARPLILRGSLIAAAALASWSSVVTVDSADQAVVTRLGRPTRNLLPGLTLKLPWPLEKVHRTAGPQSSLQMPIGWRIVDEIAGMQPPPRMMHWLTGDSNVVELRANVLFQVKDVRAWLFGTSGVSDEVSSTIESPSFALRRLGEMALTARCSGLSVEAVLSGNSTITEDVKDMVQAGADELGLGVRITQFQIKEKRPLGSVERWFLEVQNARSDGERLKKTAEREKSQAVVRARTMAREKVSEATNEANRRIKEAEGNDAAFRELNAAVGSLETPAGQSLVAEGIARILSKATVEKVQPGTETNPGVYWLDSSTDGRE